MSDLATFNPFDPKVLQCPFPHYARLREEAPVTRIEQLGVFFVTSYELVCEVLRDQHTYSSLFGGAGMPLPDEDRRKLAEAIAEGMPRVSTMLTADQPDHTRYRRLVAKAFNPRAIAELEPVVRSTSVQLIESWIDRGHIEFVESFGVALPVRGHRARVERPRRPPRRLQALVRRLDRRHRHQHHDRPAGRRRARRERVPGATSPSRSSSAGPSRVTTCSRTCSTHASTTTTRRSSTSGRSTCPRC